MAMALQQARTTVKTFSGIDVLLGIWLVIAPFALGYSAIGSALWNDIIFGAVIVLLAGMRAAGEGYRQAWPSWANVIIGLWLIAAPFVLGYSLITQALWNDVIIGIAVAILAVISALATPKETVV